MFSIRISSDARLRFGWRKIQLYWNDFEESFPQKLESWTEAYPGRKLTSLWDKDSGKDSHTNFQEYSNAEGREMFYNNLMGKYLKEKLVGNFSIMEGNESILWMKLAIPYIWEEHFLHFFLR